MIPLIPAGVILLAGVTWWKGRKRTTGMTAERRILLDTLINTDQPVSTLRTMADKFEKEGLKEPADLLRKRAALRELPPETKEKRKQVFRDAMASKDPRAVDTIAKAFEGQGATGNAAALRNYAKGLRDATTAPS